MTALAAALALLAAALFAVAATVQQRSAEAVPDDRTGLVLVRTGLALALAAGTFLQQARSKRATSRRRCRR